MLASQQSVAQTSEQIAASIAEHTEASRSALLDQQAQLNTAGEMLIASLLENITAVREALHDSRGGFIEAGDEVAATIGSRIEAVHAAIQSSSRELAESAEQIARLVESQTDLARTTLSSTGQDLLDISARVTTELSGHVASTREEIEAVHLEMNHQLEAHRQFLSEALGEHAGAAGANFADATNEVISAMAVHSERVAESLSARFVDFKTGVVSLGDVLADQLAALKSALKAEAGR
jgi:chromosome segregation ATPase